MIQTIFEPEKEVECEGVGHENVEGEGDDNVGECWKEWYSGELQKEL